MEDVSTSSFSEFTTPEASCPQIDQNPSSPASKINMRKVGHYVMGKTLGEGTFGKVREGLHVYTGEKVAVKMLEKEKIRDLSDVERVAREIHILKVIKHPNLI